MVRCGDIPGTVVVLFHPLFIISPFKSLLLFDTINMATGPRTLLSAGRDIIINPKKVFRDSGHYVRSSLFGDEKVVEMLRWRLYAIYWSKQVELKLELGAQSGYATAIIPNEHPQLRHFLGRCGRRTIKLVRPVQRHQQTCKFGLGNRTSDDIVGAVGGRFRAEHREQVFSHRHTLLTSNHTTPTCLHQPPRAEVRIVSALIMRVMRPPHRHLKL